MKIDKNDSSFEKVLDFSKNDFTNIKLSCQQNSFIISLDNNLGNNYWSTNYIFEVKKDLKETIVTNVYYSESNRNGISLSGKNLSTKTYLKDFDSKIFDSITVVPIYSFEGFQEEKEPNIKPYYDLIKNLSKRKNTENLKFSGSEFPTFFILNNIKLDKSNVAEYNDIGYYLEISKVYDSAILILEKVVQNFPKRTVAFINLGDAYWGLGKTEKAKEAYSEYVSQMEAQNKSNKIPKRVLERINQE